MVATILPGEFARTARDDGIVTVPSHTLCELLFVAAQMRSRLAFRAGNPPGRIDKTILENASLALTNARAALELSRR